MARASGRLSDTLRYRQAHASRCQSNPATAVEREALEWRRATRFQEKLGSRLVGLRGCAAVIGAHVKLPIGGMVDCEQLIRRTRLARVRHECCVEIEAIPKARDVYTVPLGFVEWVDEFNQALCLAKHRHRQRRDQCDSYEHRRHSSAVSRASLAKSWNRPHA